MDKCFDVQFRLDLKAFTVFQYDFSIDSCCEEAKRIRLFPNFICILVKAENSGDALKIGQPILEQAYFDWKSSGYGFVYHTNEIEDKMKGRAGIHQIGEEND